MDSVVTTVMIGSMASRDRSGRREPRSADLAGSGKRALSSPRFAKFIFGAVLLAAALLTFYQQLLVRVSRDAVINARLR
jgi:hypothetical protein